MGNPFLEGFSRAFEIRNQQEQARGLRDQREGLAEERRQTALKRQREEQTATHINEAFKQGGGVEKSSLAWATQNAPDAVPALTEFFTKTNESRARIAKLEDELNTSRLNHIGQTADYVLQHFTIPGAVETGLALHAEQFPNEAEQVQQLASHLQGMAPEQVKGWLEQTRNAAPAYQAKQAKNTPQVVAPGGTLVDDTGKPLFTAPTKPETVSLQSHNMLVDGKPAVVNFNPHSGQYFAPGSDQPLQNVKPIPPAATAAAANALDPDGIEYAATQYRVTGQMPPLGMGNGQARAAIINTAAKQAKGLGQSPAASIQKQAAYKADGKSLDRMRVMSSSAEAFETKALAQADIVDGLSQKVGRTNYPILNGALLAGKAQIGGDTDTQLLYNALTTFTTEYAKIMEGSTGSVAASSESARAAAAKLVSAGLSKGTLAQTIDLMRREMRLTIQGYGATIDHITQRMGGGSAPQADTSAAASSGTVRMQTPDGRLVDIPADKVGEATKRGAKKVGG